MKNRNIVKQDYKLINAKYKLTTTEIKFIMLVIAQIQKDDSEFEEYEIKVSDLESKLDVDEVNHSRLKSFAKKIMSKPILIEKENGDFEVYNWFSKIKYINGQAKFIVTIHSDLKPYLLDLRERFVKYNLKYILPLSSNYSIRLYQLLKEYEKFEKRVFSLDELHEILQTPKSYKERYNKFKTSVLMTSEKELIEHCDIFFEFEEIKKGRKVEKILFRIKQNINNQDIKPEKALSKYLKKRFVLSAKDKKIKVKFIDIKKDGSNIKLIFKAPKGNIIATFPSLEDAERFLKNYLIR